MVGDEHDTAFALADRFPGASPSEVLEWPVAMVEDALERMEIEAEVRAERERAQESAARRGVPSLDDVDELE